MDFGEWDDFEQLADEVYEDHVNVRTPKRYIRDALNPFEWYSDSEFKRRFRFSKNTVIQIIMPLIEPALRKETNRCLPITPVCQVLIALRYYATGTFQVVIGDLASVSQPTVSRIVCRITRLLAVQMRTYIKMPQSHMEQEENRRLFLNMSQGLNPKNVGLPCIDGAINCVQRRLSFTKFQEFPEAFRNRKTFFSLNVQAVVGPGEEFLDIVPTWAGSTHDSRIFQMSRIHMRYFQGEFTGALVGDRGYACSHNLLTPVNNPQILAEERYNTAHKWARNVLERVFGQWKRRFPCLQKGLFTKLATSPNIVIACAVLHNLAKNANDALPDEDLLEDEQEVPVDPPGQQPLDGLVFRRNLIRRLFVRPNDVL